MSSPEESPNAADKEESFALGLFNDLVKFGVGGNKLLCSSKALASEFLNDQSYKDNDARVDSLTNWESGKSFGIGFLTGLGGLVTLPISVPSDVAGLWMIQARMAAAIAEIYGHDADEDRIQTFCGLTLLGESATEVLRVAGVAVAEKVTIKIVEKIPGRILMEINKKVGFRIITKAGEKGAVNLIKIVPFVGGVVSGTIDLLSTQSVGFAAKQAFRPE